MGILDLANGSVTKFENVKSFDVPEEGGHYVAYLLEAKPKALETKPAAPKSETPAPPKPSSPNAPPTSPTTVPAPKEEKKEPAKPEKKKEPGTDLIVRELKTGAQTILSEVVAYRWNRPGTCLAYAVSSVTPEKDGAFVRLVEKGTARTLMTGLGNYTGLVFDKKGEQLAFLSDRDDHKAETPARKLYSWTANAEKATEIVSATTPGMPEGMTLTENSAASFSEDGAKLFVGVAPKPVTSPKDAPDPFNVDIWTFKDPLIQPMQKVNADNEKKRTYQAVWHIRQKRLVPLAGRDLPDIVLTEGAEAALGSTDLPFRALISWDTRYADYYLVRLQDGSRQKILQKWNGYAALSPGGKYVLYYDTPQKAWYTRRISDGRITNLTGKLGVSFAEEEWDTPDLPPPYGAAGWTEGDKSVLLYDRYDIWELAPDGASARMVTQGLGRGQHLVFRYQQLDPEEKFLSLTKPLLLATENDDTKATGYYRVGLNDTSGPVKLVMLDKAFGRLTKAKNADIFTFTVQRFEEFPDLWVSDTNFAGMVKLSDANPQQARYRWGHSELIDYVGADGKKRRAILTKPDDFDPHRKYPLMVYIYEKMTDGLHAYRTPAPGTNISFSRYVSKGYVLLQPDITYETGYPGESALKCVPAAVQTILAMGFIDPARIGIQGHSWGGYEITYLITRTNLFRAVEAGASVSNMISAYGGIRWGSGMSRAFQYEKSQSRIGGPPWERPLQFIENSPIFWVDKVTTPYLAMHNDADGAVPWYQGIEFFTALRRLGKEAYLFDYNGEDHGLRNRENMKHWTVHMDEFFDHYLLGAPRPDWMDNGVPYAERGKRDINALFQSEAEKTAAVTK